MSWQDDLSKSNQAFLKLVWPVIKPICGNGEIKPVEIIKDNDLAKDLDLLCGIDIWQTVSDGGCFGIANRVQFGNTNWRSFTVRESRDSGAKTEYAKRLEAIKSNGKFIYPFLTVQSYVSQDGSILIGGGVAKTVDIFNAISNRIENGMKPRSANNAKFYWVNFEEVAGCKTFTNDSFKRKAQ